MEIQELKVRNNDEKYCSECGQIIRLRAEICPKCGVRQLSPLGMLPETKVRDGKNRVVAALLAFFLGGIGGHKFYLGQVGMGLLYLVFTWSIIPWFVSFIESLLFVMMTDGEFNNRYNVTFSQSHNQRLESSE